MIERPGTAGTTIFMQDESGHLIGEYDGSENLIEQTVWMGDIPVATLQPNGSGVNIFYVHTDHRTGAASPLSGGTIAGIRVRHTGDVNKNLLVLKLRRFPQQIL